MSNCTAFPIYAIVSGHRKTLYKTHKFAAVANGTLNQFYPVKGGPGIIALPSFLYIQSCRVTAFGISLCRISLTNLPLLLHGWYKSHQFAALAVHRCHSLGNKQRQQLPKMYVATKVAPILAHQLKSHHSRKKTLKKLKNLSRFPPIKV